MAGWTFYSPETAPKALDIVWCHFPEAESLGLPSLKPRPALIQATLRKDDKVFVVAVYGTSNLNRLTQAGLYIGNYVALLDAGLPRPTCFDLVRTVPLPWAEEWFTTRDDGTGPIVGELNAHVRQKLTTMVQIAKQRGLLTDDLKITLRQFTDEN